MRFFFQKYFFCLCVLLCGITTISPAQKTGFPFIHNYSNDDFKGRTQIWGIVQDNRGVMYFGGYSGIVIFDGVNWRVTPTSNGAMVRSLSYDTKQNIIYVGGQRELGYLSINTKGRMQYHSLLHRIPEKNRDFADVWQTFVDKQGDVIFCTNKYIFKIKKKTTKVWKPKNRFHANFFINNTYFCSDIGHGLFRLNSKEELVPLPGSKDIYKDDLVYVIKAYTSNRLLLGSRKQGLKLYTPGKGYETFESEINDYLKDYRIYVSANDVSKDKMMFNTLGGGTVITDIKGKILEVLNKKVGLQDQMSLYSILDRQKNLWIGYFNGAVSHIEILNPLRRIDESKGLRGNIESITRYRNTLYVATSQGTFYWDKGKFSPITELSNKQCWDFSTFATPKDTMLLVGTDQGLFKIQNHKATQINASRHVLRVYQPVDKPNTLYGGTENGVQVFGFEKGRWVFKGKIKGIEEEIRFITQDSKRNVWLGTLNEPIVRFKPDASDILKAQNIQRFDTLRGLPSLNDVQIFNWGGKLLCGTSKGLYVFDEAQNKFILEDKLIQGRPAHEGVFRGEADAQGNLWITPQNTASADVGVALKKGQNKYEWSNIALKRLPEMEVNYIYPDKDGVVWIGGSKGLFRYDPSLKKDYKIPNKVLISKVLFGEDSLLFDGSFYQKVNLHEKSINIPVLNQPASAIYSFPYEHNSFTFHYATPGFENVEANLYSHLLKGYDTHWSEWSATTFKEYTNLAEGTYTFQVKSKNVYGTVSENIATYTFTIHPPWYRTTWAYIGYVVALLVFVVIVVRLNSRRLRKQNEYLEKVVEERTNEVTEQKREIESQRDNLIELNEEINQKNEEIVSQNEVLEQKTVELQSAFNEIKHKNKSITDSITYAQRIQKAMLPFDQNIRKVLPNHFIFWKPRDIVSGDFYWFASVETEEGKGSKQVIAAIDCTGHGVPGAFMSMVGNDLLNTIVRTEKVTRASEILNRLHAGVREALKQDETRNNDGMDLALVVIDQEAKILEYAGAHNPLIYIQNNEFKVIKGNKNAIGGANYGKQREFAMHEIDISIPTMFYLFSDGFQDQFGGPNGKKFMRRHFWNLLHEIHGLSTLEQKTVLNNKITDWMGTEHKQIDDILIIGVKV